MLFTSLPFLFVYLPIVFIGFFLFARLHRSIAAGWLAVASVFFYGYWSVKFVPLLLGSIVFNYTTGYLVSLWRDRSVWAKRVLAIGIVGNLILLAYYKYTNFFLLEVVGAHQGIEIVLPLGISFFTFTQIAFLVDTWKGGTREYNFIQYLLFVTWFPHLIAGPVLHHSQMMPQFRDPEIYRISSRNITIGVVIFAIGLAKKLLIADPISTYADPVFTAAATGGAIDMALAWSGALAYTFQIYFDFSGYSDMAVGLSMLFGVQLPINFNSPYKAVNIIEFWRRWHMTLSQFLRDYLYIPLGGNRHGNARRYINLFATMVLGGLWHGANWTYIVWGMLHGFYLCANHAWQWVGHRVGMVGRLPKIISVPVSTILTFLFVVVAWVYFRADTVHAAHNVLNAMLGRVPAVGWASMFGDGSVMIFAAYLAASSAIVWAFPNTYEVIKFIENSVVVSQSEGRRVAEMLCVSGAVVTACLITASLLSTFGTNVISPFLYFQF